MSFGFFFCGFFSPKNPRNHHRTPVTMKFTTKLLRFELPAKKTKQLRLEVWILIKLDSLSTCYVIYHCWSDKPAWEHTNHFTFCGCFSKTYVPSARWKCVIPCVLPKVNKILTSVWRTSPALIFRLKQICLRKFLTRMTKEGQGCWRRILLWVM